MPYKIVPPKERTSTRPWSEIDQASIRNRLQAGLAENEKGVRDAIREVYAILLEDDIEKAPSQNWKLPHHELTRDGEVVLNRNGLSAAAGRLNQTDTTTAKLKRGARHLAKHYAQIKVAVPPEIERLLEAQSEAQRLVAFNAAGAPVDLKTGERAFGIVGSAMVSSFRSELALLAGPKSGDEGVVVAASSDWPEGRDESERFSYATYRALSEVVLNPTRIPIDFTKKGVLKKATAMLRGRPLMKDHWRSVDEIVGQVTDTVWAEKDSARPAGINALARLNLGVEDVRGRIAPLVEAGDARATSVTVFYLWEQSHPDMDEDEFIWRLGEEVDGALVRIVVSEILRMPELSLVWDGADPFAEKLSAAVADWPRWRNNVDPQPPGLVVSAGEGGADNTGGIRFWTGSAPPGTETIQEGEEMDKFKEALAKLFGKGSGEIDESFADDVLAGTVGAKDLPVVADALVKADERIKAQAEAIGQRDATIAERDAEIDGLKPQAELGRLHLEAVRDQAVKAYKVTEGGEGNETIVAMIEEEGDLAKLEALRDKFEAEVEKLFPLRCQDCKSTNVSRASSAEEEQPGEQTGDDGKEQSGPTITARETK